MVTWFCNQEMVEIRGGFVTYFKWEKWNTVLFSELVSFLFVFFFLALAKNSCHNIKEIWTVFSNEIDNEQK